MVSGASIHYLTSGPDITPTSKVVVFCHGASFTSSTWQIVGVLDELGSQGFTTLALDLPGYGQSESLKAARLSTGSDKEVGRDDFISSFLTVVGVNPASNVVVVSASMGGTFALPFVSNPNPFRVAGYITVAGSLSKTTMSQNPPPALVIFGEYDSRKDTDQSRYGGRVMKNYGS
jgi:abhydrolase domain-containing protein 14